jgi:hypothetical protein
VSWAADEPVCSGWFACKIEADADAGEIHAITPAMALHVEHEKTEQGYEIGITKYRWLKGLSHDQRNAFINGKLTSAYWREAPVKLEDGGASSSAPPAAQITPGASSIEDDLDELFGPSRQRTIDKIMESKTMGEIMEVIASHPPPKKADGPPKSSVVGYGSALGVAAGANGQPAEPEELLDFSPLPPSPADISEDITFEPGP